jgi:hypothetical protein
VSLQFVYKWGNDRGYQTGWYLNPPQLPGFYVEKAAIVIKDIPETKSLLVQPMGHEPPMLIEHPERWESEKGSPPIIGPRKKFYAYYRPRDDWVFLGEFKDHAIAETEVVKKVSTIGLRCLFRWTANDEYTCGSEEQHVRGRILRKPLTLTP